MTRARFDIHVDSTATGVVHAVECIVEEEAGLARRVDSRYTPEYAEDPRAFPLDPKRLTVGRSETQFACAGGVPGFIDDHLPDAWGRRVLAALAQHRDGKRFNQNSAIDLLTVVPAGSRIGALSFAPPGDTPRFDHGAPFAALAEAERAAVHVDALDLDSVGSDEFGLARLAAAGSSVGGARPKALVTDGDSHYLAKFNRLSDDPYAWLRTGTPTTWPSSTVCPTIPMRACAEEVLAALDGWPAFAEEAGLDESESERIGARLNP